jgi:pimeloyl-ACP methyl ester carboxylesterase
MPTAGGVRYLEALPPPSARARGALVLLHAFPLNARMWEGQLAFAGHGWHVIAPHMRGTDGGIDDRPTASVTMDDYAADIVDLLDALHVEDAVLCGLSMGGYLALALMRHAPTYIRGLILADTKSQADTPEGLEARRGMLSLVETKGVKAVAEAMIPKLLGATTQAQHAQVVERVRSLIMANSPESVAGSVRALMSRRDTTSLLASIRVPTLVIVGDEDVVTPPANADELRETIPGAEFARIPSAGHLSNLEAPDAFNAALTRFLDHRV